MGTHALKKFFARTKKVLDNSGPLCYTIIRKNEREELKMTTEQVYNKKYEQFCKGEISSEEWYEFCAFVLELLMEENADVLKNLKEKW